MCSSSLSVWLLIGHRYFSRREITALVGGPGNMAPLPPYFGNTATAKVVTAEKRKNANRQNIAAVLHYRRKNTAIFWFYRFRQKSSNSRYRQKVPPTPNTAKRVPSTLDPAQKVPPSRNSAQKVPPTLDIAQRYRRYWIPPKRYHVHWIPPKKSGFSFRVRSLLLFFLVLRVPFR